MFGFEINWSYVLILPVAAGTLLAVMFLQWWERRLLGWWQDRRGPNRVGWFGVLQGVADGIKFITKDDWVPPFGDRAFFVARAGDRLRVDAVRAGRRFPSRRRCTSWT